MTFSDPHPDGAPALVVLLGPTGVGKTNLSLRLAEALGCPIVSADSRQIYRGLPIGTAAPTEEELRRVRHFFIHTLNLEDYYSAAQYERDVLQLLPHLFQTRSTALMVGGSMMYIDAVTKGIDDIPSVPEDVRLTLRARLDEEGLPALVEELRRLDPEYYEVVDRKNPKRVVHALEICHTSGETYTSFRTRTPSPRPFRVLKIGLTRSRDSLFARINARVDQMMRDGLLAEAQALYPHRYLNSLNTVGYKELFRVIDGEWELPMAVERIKKNTRVYAKKQMTWFQRDPDIRWMDADTMGETEMIGEILALVAER